MCGIIACLGDESSIRIMEGLVQLQNRGYDSAGISLIYNGYWVLKKYISDNVSSITKLNKLIYPPSINGIGHTRWATHGPKTELNAHPHLSHRGKIMLVHNGIIDNYIELKAKLSMYVCKSQTDSEVIANLIEYYYNIYSIEEAIKKAVSSLKGTWALCIQCKDEPNKIYCARYMSPLLISTNDKFALVSSEKAGFCGIMTDYFELDPNDICILEYKNNNISIKTNNSYVLNKIIKEDIIHDPSPYIHWTIKEINEQTTIPSRVTQNMEYFKEDGSIIMDGLTKHIEVLTQIKHIILLGCGTSLFASNIGAMYLKRMCNFNSVHAYDAGEFTKHDIPKDGKCAFILVTQSGETMDLINCFDIIKENVTIGIINCVDSTIDRRVTCGCYLKVGREVGVASTKSFVSQVLLLSMVSLWFSQLHGCVYNKDMITDIKLLSGQIESTIKRNESVVKSMTHLFKENCFILGKGFDEYVAKEGALKIKELSYIHAEGYSSSSLKHGPFALLLNEFPVILISPRDKYWNKNENIYEEIKSRGATIITITNEPSQRENVILVEKNNTYQNILNMIPLQLFSYELSIMRGYNPDLPRNLAKVVTV